MTKVKMTDKYVYCWGFLGHMECILDCNSWQESWEKVSPRFKGYLLGDNDDYYKESNCLKILIKDGKFEAYDVWETDE